jgi:glycosyltransferase involved in cell wall biosynthesis
MKILLVYHKFYPMLGGVENYLFNLAQAFIKMKIKVDVLCSDEGMSFKKKEKIKGIQVYRYPMPKIKKKDMGEWPLKHEEEAKCFIRENLDFYDLILVRSPIYINSLLNNYKKEKIIFIAPSFYHEFFKSIKFKKKEQEKARDILIKMELNLYKKKIKVIALSNLIKKQVNSKIKAKIRVVPPGIDIKKFEYNFSKNKYVLFVGRLGPEKNVSSLIRSFKFVSKGKLLIIGGGKMEKELKKLVISEKLNKRVKFFGWIKNQKKIYSNASVFVLPSKYESFGHVLLEAMACGLPCIAFKPDGKKINTASEEIIDNGKTGFLVKNEKEMAEKINLLLSDEKLRKMMSKNSRKEAEKYSWEECAKKILKESKYSK